MSPHLRRRLAALSALALLALTSRAALADLPRDSGGGCPFGISPENATKLYDQLKAFQGADGCTLDEVRTEREQMLVVWVKAQGAQPGILVEPSVCAKIPTVRGPTLAMTVPPGTAEACAAAVAEMGKVISKGSFGDLVPANGPQASAASLVRRWLWQIVAGIGVLLAAVALVVWRRRSGQK